MTIEIRRVTSPTHLDNLFYDVKCFNCREISEENGDYLPGPCELVSWESHVNFSQAMKISYNHQLKEGVNHRIVVREFDSGEI